MTTTPNSRIEITASNRVHRKKPRALKPYMTDEVWENFCDDMDEAMKPWVHLTRISSRIARVLGGSFLLFAIAYTTLRLFNHTADEADTAAYVLFPILMMVVVCATCWLLRVLPKTNNHVMERIEGVLERATTEINQHMQRTTISMKYQEDEKHSTQGKSTKWVQVGIVNENGDTITGDDAEDPSESEHDGFTLV